MPKPSPSSFLAGFSSLVKGLLLSTTYDCASPGPPNPDRDNPPSAVLSAAFPLELENTGGPEDFVNAAGVSFFSSLLAAG
jgi:hypothetical protein